MDNLLAMSICKYWVIPIRDLCQGNLNFLAPVMITLNFHSVPVEGQRTLHVTLMIVA